MAVAFSPNGKYLATGSDDKTVNLLDIEARRIWQKFDKIHDGNIYNKKNICICIYVIMLMLYDIIFIIRIKCIF